MNDIYTLLFLAIGLSMDAFAVSICKGLSLNKITFGKALIVGLWFGIFQGLMPIIGYYLGQSFISYITKVDHWIAFGLLALIGCNMIREAVEKRRELKSGAHLSEAEQKKEANPLAFKTMFVMAVATSIDALAVGLSMAMAENEGGFNIWESASVIAVVTCILSMVGVKVGAVFGHKYEDKAEFVGGIILIAIGIRVLVEHLAASAV